MHPDERKFALNMNSKTWDLEQLSETLLPASELSYL